MQFSTLKEIARQEFSKHNDKESLSIAYDRLLDLCDQAFPDLWKVFPEFELDDREWSVARDILATEYAIQFHSIYFIATSSVCECKSSCYCEHED